MSNYSMLAFGGNADSDHGSPLETIKFALRSLPDHGVFSHRVSDCFATPAFPAGSGPDYVNAAAVVRSDLDPAALLSVLHRVEAACGRVRHKRWGARTLDIDLIGQGALVRPDRATFEHWRDLPLAQQTTRAPEQLILPHPRLQDRAFVLVPLAEVAPDWIHPVSGLSVTRMLEKLPESDRKAVVRL
ncbi:2-amino-4-hydroxy-6-hydroxymethyldihydropteridine diphosphokinase [Cognatishimia sp. SS12]|uniref:2-amino-4-hydroxy-6- hydroxymethyldihydropteridine diphosphokinase n=1 Tax=Cognatishimia sp. SS12 TaxID=2979465 RepID=UPI0023307A58|nr:2-amino-4-hydroxy-6-hydroxymethyldihydropteridine diphosphokinase [Cognatishimia sp. SS12]MDC0739232.1 2-amino-4-hydroxy-6-hydroxymethyldihydropteridine diphosphokinase [Cognatishimia sp. SS12]